MKAGCRIRTRSTAGHTTRGIPSLRLTPLALRLPTDSKALSTFSNPLVHPEGSLVRSLFVIGPERAITQMPMNFNLFHADAARREL
jgi:hypothetical protein